MIKTVAWKTLRLFYVLIGIVLIVLALCTVAAWVGLPLLANHKDSIEHRVSEYLNSPVSIGELSLRWSGTGPVLYARDVAIQENDQRTVKVDELYIDVDVASSLLRGQMLIKELNLIGADLVVDRDEEGQLQLHGVRRPRRGNVPGTIDQPPGTTTSDGLDAIAWLFNVEKIALLDTSVTFLDRQSGQQFMLDDINIYAENTGQLHQLRVHCNLPYVLGGELEAGIDLRGSVRQLSQMSGDLYFKADNVNLKGVTELLTIGGLSDNSLASLSNLDAQAAVELWGTWQDGQFSSLRGPLSLSNLTRADSGKTVLDGLGFDLKIDNTNALTEVVASNLVLELDKQSAKLDQIRFSRNKGHAETAPSHDVSISATEKLTSADAAANISIDTDTDRQAHDWQLLASGDAVPLDLITSTIADVLADGQPALSDTLHNSGISGLLNDVVLSVRDGDSLPLISFSANTENLTVAGNSSLPEFGPLSARVSLEDSQGTVTFSANQAPLSWSAVSDQQLQVDRLSSTWNIDLLNSESLLLGGDVQLDDDGIETRTAIKVELVPGAAPHLDIRSRFAASDITKLKAWLPDKIMSPGAVEWLDEGLVEGEAKDGQLFFFGSVDEFPFEQGEGVFRGSVDVDNGTLSFLPDWPNVSGINTTLEIDGLTFSGVSEQGLLAPFNISSASFVIDDLRAPVLDFSGTAEGSLPELTDFAVNGPLADILGPAMSDLSGSGDTQMDLELTVPLFDEPAAGSTTDNSVSDWRPFKVNGSVFLAGNNVNFEQADLVLRGATGAVGFNENGIVINNVGGSVLSQRVRLSGKTVGVGSAATTTISLSGTMEANDLLAHYENSLDQFIRGTSLWHVDIAVPHSEERLTSEGVQLDINSDLVGSQLLLPAPYNKSTSSSVPFRLSTQFLIDQPQQRWQADYGDQLSASVKLVDDELQSVLIELSTGDSEGTESTNNEVDAFTSQTAFEGIRLQGHVDSLAADGWIETVAKYIESLPASDPDDQTPILPVSADLTADALILGKFSFGAVTLQSSTEAEYLNFDVQNRRLKGSLQYPREHWQQQTPLIARLDLLDWSIIDALSGDDTGAAAAERSTPLDPRLLPPIDARLAELRRDNVRIRDLAMRTEPNVSGLDVTALGFAYDTMRLVGKGHWYLSDPQQINASAVPRHVTQLDLVMQGSDYGTGLDSIGLSEILDDTQGSIEMQLRWPGALYQPDIASLDGTVELDLQAGSIVPLEPGAGRIMGLFALQALPRRLNLDFKDLTADGLAFTTIAGKGNIENGVVETPLLQLTGPIGVVDITGTSDLSAEEFNQQITVLPRVSAALPIIGAISGGASAGIGALVAAGFLKAIGVDFDRIGLRTYSLTGQWQKPKLTSIPSDFLGRR